MILTFCLLLILGCVTCQEHALPSASEVESSINRTIEEVERMVRLNASLPRLSRQDIVQILFNITSKEIESLRDQKQIDKARKLYQKALMVVLPYSAKENSDLKDLYTKPPMTQIIPDYFKSEEIEAESEDRGKAEILKVNNSSAKSSPQRTSGKIDQKNRYKNHRETYSDVHTKAPLKETLKRDSAPVRFTFNLENLQKKNPEEITTQGPVYRKEWTSKRPENETQLLGSTSTEFPEVPKTEDKDRRVPKPFSSGLKSQEEVLSSDQWRYNAPPPTRKPVAASTLGPKFNRRRGKPTTTTSTTTTTTESSTESGKLTETTAVYVTPMSSDIATKDPEITKTSTPMRKEVMDLLESIGLRPNNSSTNLEEIYKNHKESLKSKSSIPGSNSLIRSPTSSLSSPGPSTASIVSQNTFTNQETEIKKGVDNLSPDVQSLFKKFGLQTSNLDPPASSTTPSTTTKVNSYTNFKPLSMSRVKDDEMREFLARFGLGVENSRREKAITSDRSPMLEAVPENMKGVLENIGLVPSVKKKKIRDSQSLDSSRVHVFKPHEADLASDEQRTKVNQLLEKVRQVQKGTANIREVQKAAKDLLDTTKTLENGPDPLRLEEILRIYSEDTKNEVKRQQETATQNPETTTTSTTALDGSTKVPEGSTEDSISSGTNLKDLEDSFGGTTAAPDPVLPTRPRSGLYFLVDWNSFLEVGEDEREKVNLRFQPKVGDRSRFLPVTVP